MVHRTRMHLDMPACPSRREVHRTAVSRCLAPRRGVAGSCGGWKFGVRTACPTAAQPCQTGLEPPPRRTQLISAMRTHCLAKTGGADETGGYVGKMISRIGSGAFLATRRPGGNSCNAVFAAARPSRATKTAKTRLVWRFGPTASAITIMSLSSLLIFAAALFVAAGSPGPSIAALVARVIAKGWRDVLPFLAAMWIGEAIWLSLAVFGLAFVAQTFHFAFVIVKWAGVAYLVFLAWKMWTAPVAVRDGELPRNDSRGQAVLCRHGRHARQSEDHDVLSGAAADHHRPRLGHHAWLGRADDHHGAGAGGGRSRLGGCWRRRRGGC